MEWLSGLNLCEGVVTDEVCPIPDRYRELLGFARTEAASGFLLCRFSVTDLVVLSL